MKGSVGCYLVTQYQTAMVAEGGGVVPLACIPEQNDCVVQRTSVESDLRCLWPGGYRTLVDNNAWHLNTVVSRIDQLI